jgi:sporulation protein YlmC with PRC-barrel domain
VACFFEISSNLYLEKELVRMRKLAVLLSVLVLAAIILAACGGEETSTNVPSTSVPPVTAAVTSTGELGTATEAPTEATATTTTSTPGTSGIPVTGGAANSDSLSNELHFTVWDQTGKQVGKVDDMVLDLSKAKVIYVVVNAGGKKIPVPWAFLKVGPASASSYPNEQQNAFTLQADSNTLKNAPVLDLKNVPELGAEPDSWDISFRKYWEGNSTTTSSRNTPSPAGTAVTDMTATATSTSNGAGNATSTSVTSLGTSQGTGTDQGAISIQGVQLASNVLGAKLTVGVPSLSLSTPTPGAGTGLATSTPSAAGGGTGLATSTPSAGSTGLATSTPGANTSLATSTPSTNTSTKNLSASIDDLIVNIDSGDIMYIVVKTNFEDGEHLIPVPLRPLQWDAENKAFILNIEAALLQNAPFFQKDQFPDLTMPGWNSEFDSFWQNNGSGGSSGTGSGTGTQATTTP